MLVADFEDFKAAGSCCFKLESISLPVLVGAVNDDDCSLVASERLRFRSRKAFEIVVEVELLVVVDVATITFELVNVFLLLLSGDILMVVAMLLKVAIAGRASALTAAAAAEETVATGSGAFAA